MPSGLALHVLLHYNRNFLLTVVDSISILNLLFFYNVLQKVYSKETRAPSGTT